MRRCIQSPVSLNPEARPRRRAAAGVREALVKHAGVGRHPIRERPVLMGCLKHHGLDVFPRRVEGELGRRAAGLRRRRRDRVRLLVWSGPRWREGGRSHVLREAERAGGQGAGGQRVTRPVVFEDLNGQRGH